MSPIRQSLPFQGWGRREWVPALLCRPPASPPEESCPRLPQGWLQGGSGLDWKGPAGVAGTGRGTLSVVAELRPGQPGLSVVLVCQSLIS